MPNPMMQLIQLARAAQNPQAFVMNMLEQRMGQTPFGQNLLSLAKAGQTGDIEQVVRNLAAQQGIDYDADFAAFRNLLGF